MPHKRFLKLSLHKATGQARVRLDGEDIYLGQCGSRESVDRYEDLKADRIRSNGDAVRYTFDCG